MKTFNVKCRTKNKSVEAMSAYSALSKVQSPPRGWRWISVDEIKVMGDEWFAVVTECGINAETKFILEDKG